MIHILNEESRDRQVTVLFRWFHWGLMGNLGPFLRRRCWCRPFPWQAVFFFGVLEWDEKQMPFVSICGILKRLKWWNIAIWSQVTWMRNEQPLRNWDLKLNDNGMFSNKDCDGMQPTASGNKSREITMCLEFHGFGGLIRKLLWSCFAGDFFPGKDHKFMVSHVSCKCSSEIISVIFAPAYSVPMDFNSNISTWTF